ncbi:MAG: PRC-barrel domain-containing protein [Syntrophomonas sp.]|uniref:PRC-barrel domain-containing protein n=1 Tax=Syntrophomonas sp. TaxID=2053627 RepID=UPI00260941C6|nr:PRC-barrel domain-containing protein [Syntrophomonas sp.]MDD2510678.1 PRC-barrel domain-containing protein [Syntrophomonas sp.]MDD3878706.1 PRC-barrel domain-containing protein [Syntrophomonas sp.]MDD4626158.1 PRC-barrel domain-containing protein [Syntrophomonas sp.]
MKKTQEIIGLPVFSVLDGKKIGQVKDLVINPEEGKVDFILVSNRNWYDGARVLGYKSVMGIGEHAVTTESENLLTTINETANANKLLERNIELKGNRVLTNKGNLIGVISEFIVDEDTGAIACLEFRTAEDESKIEIIDAKQVMTYGFDVIVIKQEEEAGVFVQQEEAQEKPAPISEIQAENEIPPVVLTTTPSPEPAPIVAPTAPTPPGSSDGAAFFKQKQRQFLLGKKLIQDIRDAIGNVLIAQETLITEEILDLAERNNKFVELTQCAR